MAYHWTGSIAAFTEFIVTHERPDRRALHVARATIYLARDWHLGHLVPPGAAELSARFLYSYSPKEVHRFARTQSPSFRQLLSALEYMTAPGMALHYAVRKLAIEELVRTRLKAGVRQVVVLGAGFDTLALRLHREFPEVTFFEVDRACNQTVKLRALMGQWAPAKNIGFIDADAMRDPLEQKLLANHFVSGVPTLFVAEALLASMGAAQRDHLLDFVRAVGGPGCSLVFTVMERGPDGKVHYRGAKWTARWWWRRQGMRLEWGPSRLELDEYLRRHGFVLGKLLTAKDFRVRFLDGNRDVPLAEGEDVAIADVVKT